MVNVANELKKLGIEVSDEQKEFLKKSMGEELYSKEEMEDKVKKESEQWKTRAESAEKMLEGLDGKSPEDILKERDDWKRQAEDSKKDYEAKIAEHEKDELLKEAFAEIEFTSESAKKAIMKDISESVSVKNGKLIGFSDLIEEAKKTDANAFVNKQNPKAYFTKPNEKNSGGDKPTTRESILSIKDRSERQKAIAENISLFQQ
nr:MAG TPA: minor structural protein [Caudoviricetes sp.]